MRLFSSTAKRTSYSWANLCEVLNLSSWIISMPVGLNFGKMDCMVGNIQENDNNERYDLKLDTQITNCPFNDKRDFRTVKVEPFFG